MATVRWFDSKYKSYNWQGLSQLGGLGAKARRSAAQLLPYSWSRLDWMVFQSARAGGARTRVRTLAGMHTHTTHTHTTHTHKCSNAWQAPSASCRPWCRWR